MKKVISKNTELAAFQTLEIKKSQQKQVKGGSIGIQDVIIG